MWIALYSPLMLPERLSRLLLLPVTLLALVGCADEPAAPPEPGTPRLVVLVVLDQVGGETLQRFDRFWEGGFRHLFDHGAYWVDARHDHAITHTAPGHASLATGCLPRNHGMVANTWIDRESGDEVYSAENDDDIESPERLLCESLGDWMKRRYPTSKVYSVSTKDRSAVALGGFGADAALFYDDDDGEFESSSYYLDEDPEWLEAFNDERALDTHFGTAWEPLPVPDGALAELGVEPFELGPFEPDFPITFGALTPVPGESFYSEIRYSPFVDEQTARLALTVLGAEALGGDPVPDLLAISFSGPDYVGHRFGPDSPQYLDALRRLDRTFGAFLETLDRRIGLEHVVLALSADHGAAPLPELRAQRGEPGKRADDADVLCMQGVHARLEGRFGVGRWLSPGPFVSAEAHEAGRAAEVEAAADALITACPGVRQVWTRSELMGSEAQGDAVDSDPKGRLYRNSFHPERSPDLMVERDEYFLSSLWVATSHGTAWRYDTHVPLMLLAPGVAAGPRGDSVRTVDLAPTLAWKVGAVAGETIDGVVLDLGDRP